MKWIEWQQMFLSLPFFFSSLLNTGLFFVARLKVEGVIGRNEEETVGAVVSLSFCSYKQHVLDTLCSREREARVRSKRAILFSPLGRVLPGEEKEITEHISQ